MSEIYVPQTEGDSREERLHQLRREAQRDGHVGGDGIRAVGAPFPVSSSTPMSMAPRASAETGYYNVPLLKAPQWKWEIPVYLFTGGFAGAASIMASFARLTRADHDLVREARLLAAIGGSISPALLISDLGVPSRFLNMLRVFKLQSPMSMGSWTLVTFSSSASGLSFLDLMRRRTGMNGNRPAIRVLENAAEFVSVISGAALSTYTGVLIGATAVPVWNENIGMLPIHFAASGMGAAASLLELRGHQTPALSALAMASAGVETFVGTSIELRQKPVLEPLKKGRSGWLTRIGGLLSGPLPLALRLVSLFAGARRKSTLRKAAAVSAVAGSVVTRFAWVQAGKVSAADPRIPLQLPPAPASTNQVASASETSPA